MAVTFWAGNPLCVSIDFRYVAQQAGAIHLYPEIDPNSNTPNLIGVTITYFENLTKSQCREDHPQFRGVYLLDRLSDPMLVSLRERNSFLFIDYSGEAAIVDEIILSEFHQLLLEYHIPELQVILSTCNWAFAQDYRNWYEKNSISPIHVVCYDHFLYHFSSTLRANQLDSYEDLRQEILKGAAIDTDRRLLICLNNMPRMHRFAIMTFLIQYELSGRGDVSFLQPLEEQYIEGVWNTIQTWLPDFPVERKSYDELLRRIPIVADREQQHSRAGLASELGSFDMYRSNWFSVITESDMGHYENQRITEKVLKPLANGHLFLLAGNYRALAKLRAHGFRSYGYAISEDYDEISDPVQRLGLVLKEVMRLAALSAGEFAALYGATAKDRLHNFDLVWQAYKRYASDPIHQQIEKIVKG